MADVNLKHQLGLSLLKGLCKTEKDNLVFSPLSLGTAFAMLAAGLRGETRDELLNFLGCKDLEAVHKLYSGLVSNKALPLKVANKYIAQQNIKVREQYSILLQTKYESGVETADFITEGRHVEERVNEWVSEKTSGMIKELLPKYSLTPDTVLVLLNAVYFKGTWEQEFKPIPMGLDFYLRDGTKVKKNFMTKTSNKFKYHETEKLRLVKIPYKEAGCYMVVALPLDGTKHIDEIILETTPTELASAIAELSNYVGPSVALSMPKFKIEYDFNDIKKHMLQLGVDRIFKAGIGDFSNMFSRTEMMPPLCVSDVKHRTAVEIDEVGTKAAAATAVRVMARCGTFSEPFLVDRPFYFGIYAGSDDFCLFQGIYRK